MARCRWMISTPPRGRLRFRRDLAFGAARRRDHPDLHLRDNGESQRGGDDAHQPAVRGLCPRDVLDVRPDDRATSYLPSAHIADRMMALYNQEMYGLQVTVVSDVREIAAALPDARPTMWAAVHGCGKSSKPQSNSRWPTSRTRQSARHCSGRCRSPRNAPRRWSPTSRCPTRWPPSGRRPTNWCSRSCARSWGFDELRWAVSGARRSRGRRSRSSSVSASRSPRSGACRS